MSTTFYELKEINTWHELVNDHTVSSLTTGEQVEPWHSGDGLKQGSKTRVQHRNVSAL